MSSLDDDELEQLRNKIFAHSEALKRQLVTELSFLPESAELAAWRQDKKIFAVLYDAVTLYPAFQFDEQQRPLPIIEETLKIFSKDPRRTDWQNLFWFVSANGWLGGKPPQSCLKDGRAAVIDAVTQEIKSMEDY